MQIRIKDVANLSTDYEDGVYDSEVVPRAGEFISYAGDGGRKHYKVLSVWYSGNPNMKTQGAWLFCEQLSDSPFQLAKQTYKSDVD